MHDIPFCLNTDNPYLVHTNLRKEQEIIGAELGGDSAILLPLAMEHAARHRFITD